MKYCKKCKRIYKDSETVCRACERPLGTLQNPNTLVYLLTASGFEFDRTIAALKDSGLSYSFNQSQTRRDESAPMGIDWAEKDIFVPYSEYDRAFDVCLGIGAIKDESARAVEESEEPLQAEEEEAMSPAKRRAVRIASAIAFIAIAAAAIFATDAVTGFIKNLFG